VDFERLLPRITLVAAQVETTTPHLNLEKPGAAAATLPTKHTNNGIRILYTVMDPFLRIHTWNLNFA
jgi:hypothetical protein